MSMDRNPHLPSPAEEDPVVDRFLGTLPRPEPSPAFEMRVLNRVWRPVPRRLREVSDRIFRSWQAKLFLGLLAAGAFLWQAVLVSLAMQFPAETRETLAVGAREVLPTVRNQIARLLGVLIESVKAWLLGMVSGYAVWLMVALFVILVSGAGLFWVLRSGRLKHAWQ
jgi:hypothetical protein